MIQWIKRLLGIRDGYWQYTKKGWINPFLLAQLNKSEVIK